LAMTFFSGISGSALADAAGPGSVLIKMMGKGGYSTEYAAALTASIAIVGPIIPPSIVMIVYALADERVSVVGLFYAGVIPGILIAAAMAIVNHYISVKRGYRAVGTRPSAREMLANTWKAIPALIFPLIILGGIHGGIFTPTEASVVAVFYALLAGKLIYRTLTWDKLPGILYRSAMMSCSVLMIVAMSQAFAWVLTIGHVPQAISQAIGTMGLSPLALLMVVNLFLLVFGIFIEPLPGVMVLVPILAPLAAAAGIDPLHFAIVVIVNLTLGLLTPPVGGLLFVTSSVARIPMTSLVRELWPFLWAQFAVLLILTLFPWFSLALPRALGH
jgi:C4-dicarboxylate transporter DctM subunit